MSRNINHAGGGSRSRGGGGDAAAAAGFRVSIPANVRSIIQSIRETTGKQHSDEEIYSVLQDCSMDPNETAQKLLYLDTFHEVKKKRDRRKEVQGTRVARGNYYSNSTSDGRSGRNSASRRENGVGPGSRRAKSNAVPHEKKVSAAVPNGTSSLHIGSINHVPDSKRPVDGVLPEPKIDVAVDAKKSLTAAHHPAPTFASVIRAEKENLVPISNPDISAKNPTTRGIVSQQKGVESNDDQGNKTITSDMDMKLLMGGKVLNASNSILKEEAKSNSEVVNKNQSTEPLQSAPLLTHDSSLFVHSSNNDGQLSQGSAPPPTGSATVLKKATSQSLPESVVPDGQNVTFPNHFKVPEAVKSGLVFGSISAGSGLTSKYVNGTTGLTISLSAIESSHTNDESAEEPLTSGQSVSSTGQTQSHDILQSSPLLDEVPSSADHISTSTNLKQDEPKQEMPLLSGGHQKPHVQNVPNYGIGLMLPTAPGGQLAPMEGPGTQAPNVSQISNFVNGNSLASSTSPVPVQSSVAATPQPPPHLFRQPYPSFLPYGQYLPPYIMPQIPHQFLTPNGLPQQSSTGNLYLQSAAAAAVAAGVKFPLSQFKPAANASNPAHMGMPSGFGSYGSSPIGFNPLTAGSSGKSSSNEDIATSQLKDNHVYTTGPLSEGLGVWMTAPGQDLLNIQMNPLYNLNLHGPPLTFAPPHTGQGPFPGIYQPPQTVTPPSNNNPLLQQSQPMAAAAAEHVGPPSGAYQQQPPPQIAQMNWNRSY